MDYVKCSALNLAYLGDAVFELFVRERLLKTANAPVGKRNEAARRVVNAKAQARMYFKIFDELTEAEKAVLKRGRNAHARSRAKSADVLEYRRATALETLLGFLYLDGNVERLNFIVEKCMEGELCDAL
ncbi:MAG: ribonuclease III [Clostridiales bacterium]|jgi:ribonuclease-3 family protein|nr:ribonuclease III [Clostridiales bacterium]